MTKNVYKQNCFLCHDLEFKVGSFHEEFSYF